MRLPGSRCSLFILQDPFDLTTAIEVPITFAQPPDACPEGGTYLSGSGGSAGFREFLGWATQICEPPDSIGLQYTLRPGQSALDDYIQGASNFAVSSGSLDGQQRTALRQAGGTAGYAPIAASALEFVYRIFDQRTGEQITDLVLTPEILARIFTGKLIEWNDPAIKKLNPGHVFPSFIASIGRGDANEDTLTMTQWIWASARDTWIKGGMGSSIKPNPFGVGPTPLLPSLGQIYLVTGVTQEARTVGTGGTDFGSTSVYGTIGYLDSSWAAQFALPAVRIRFPDGETVAATPSTIQRAVEQMRPNGQCVLTPDVGVEDAEVWPMPTISYAIVPHGASASDSPPAPDVAAGLATLIRYGVGTGQKHLPAGYVPLPDDLRHAAIATAATIEKAPPDDCEPPPPPPPKHHDTGGGGTVTPPPSGGPTSTGGPSQSPSPTGASSTPSPSPQIVYVAAQAPPMTLTAARAGMILPVTVLLALLALVVSTCLLFGNRVTARLAPAAQSIKRASPRALMRRGRAKEGGP